MSKIGRKEYLTIGLILICTILFAIIHSSIVYRGQEISMSRAFVYFGTSFLGGLMIFGIPIFIIYLISVVYSQRKTKAPIPLIKSIPEEGMKYCSNCGEKIKKNATFCEFCGSKQ